MKILERHHIDNTNKLDEIEFEELTRSFRKKAYAKGDFIIKEGDRVNEVYFIFSGLVKLSCFDEDVRECILSFAFEYWWETDFSAFYNQSPASLVLQCLEDTVVYALTYEDYLTLCERYSGITEFFLDKSIKGHIASQKRILSLLMLNPKGKYETFLSLYPALVQRIPKSVLALYLGVSRETLSRLYHQNKNRK